MLSKSEEIRWRWLQERLRRDPAWVGKKGEWVAGLLLLGAMGAWPLVPIVGVVLLACALVALGVTALSDFAIRGRARFDPRGATLFLVVGIGALLVMAARVLWG